MRRSLTRDIGRTADQHEAAIAIAAFGIALVAIDLDKDARMTECGGNIPRPIAGNARLGDTDGFRRLDHGDADSIGNAALQYIGRFASTIFAVMTLA